MNHIEATQSLLSFIEASPASFQVVDEARRRLEGAGFRPLVRENPWPLAPGGKYYTTLNGSALIAFIVGRESGFRMVAAHNDSPCFRLKPAPELAEAGLWRLNVEAYGGAIISSWFDRPLSLAGRLLLRGDDPLHPRSVHVDLAAPFCTIPNLCIHMNRELNEGYRYNLQKDTLPIFAGYDGETPADVLCLLAQKAGVDRNDVLDFDVTVYCAEPGVVFGADQAFFSSPRIDNLGMVHAALESLLAAAPKTQTALIYLADNEEVGSQTRQGAASPFLRDVLARIYAAVGTETLDQALAASFLISADQAHAAHPNYPEKSDPVNAPQLNGGPVIKQSAAMNYASDGFSGAVFQGICDAAQVPCQRFTNRSDQRGGATLGPICNRHLNVPTVDVGNPLLAMHSAREMGGSHDQSYMIRALTTFFNLPGRI